jgi:hypothetical protein
MNSTGKFIVKNGVTYAPDKDPNDILDYSIDWSQFLDTDTIDTSTWTVATGITKVSDTKAATTTTIWLSGGTAGATYQLTNRITTVNGRVKDKSFSVYVAEQ